jgi:hypothetical protein
MRAGREALWEGIGWGKGCSAGRETPRRSDADRG